jgi:hypothetical protein
LDFICSVLKEEAKWEEPKLRLRKIRKEQFLQEHQIKANYLYVIGLPDPLMKQGAKMIPLLGIGINKEVIDQ